MATNYQVTKAIAEFYADLDQADDNMTTKKSNIETLRARVANLPSQYSDEITTIGGYAPTGARETLAQDDLVKLTADRTALLARIDAVLAEFATQGF